MKKWAALLAILVAAAAVAITSTGEAGPALTGSRDIGDPKPLEQHLISTRAAPLGPVDGQARRARRWIVKLFGTKEIPVEANGSEGGTLACPRRYVAMDGGFGTNGGIVVDQLAPLSLKKYSYAAFDVTGQTGGTVYFTLTCRKG